MRLDRQVSTFFAPRISASLGRATGIRGVIHFRIPRREHDQTFLGRQLFAFETR